MNVICFVFHSSSLPLDNFTFFVGVKASRRAFLSDTTASCFPNRNLMHLISGFFLEHVLKLETAVIFLLNRAD